MSTGTKKMSPVSEKPVLVKIVMVGEDRVGKTNIFSVYVRQKFLSDYKTTVNVQFGTKKLSYQGKDYQLQVWDASGESRYRRLAKGASRGVEAIVGVYDLTRQESLNKAVEHIKETIMWLGEEGISTVALVLAGNKLDKENDRQVTTIEGQETADRLGAKFTECSALNNTNIDEIFRLLLKERSKKLGKNVVWWKSKRQI